MSLISYHTLGKAASEELIINKSRFIGYAAPCGSAEEALDYLAAISLEHPDASHHCFAYVIGSNAGIMRYSDDGEPSGTAGLPIMSVLKVRELRDVCVVVVRYFGGVLLGAGGLVRAYTKSAAQAVDAAGIVVMNPTVRLTAELPYPLWDRVQRLMEKLPLIVEDTRFTQAVSADIMVRQDDLTEVIDSLKQQSEGRALIEETGRLYYGWPTDMPST